MRVLLLLSVPVVVLTLLAEPRVRAQQDTTPPPGTTQVPPSQDTATPPSTEPQLPVTPPAPATPSTDAPAEVVALPDVPVFTTRTNLVVLHVNVLDGRRPVANLRQDAFHVYENGAEQTIEFFGASEVPIAAGLVIDNSSSMLSRRPMVRAGVQAFAQAARDNDEMFTIIFNEHVRSGLPPSVGFTRSRDQLLAALAIRAPGGLTALHDAVIEGLSHLATSTNQKRVLVVLSDGKDNASTLTESNMMYRASQSNALIYTIWTGDVAADRGNPALLDRLAQGSGGVAYQPRSEREVVAAFSEAASNLRRSYTISYSPTNSNADGTYRQVRVDVRADGRRLTTRTRRGYIAPDDTLTKSTSTQP